MTNTSEVAARWSFYCPCCDESHSAAAVYRTDLAWAAEELLSWGGSPVRVIVSGSMHGAVELAAALNLAAIRAGLHDGGLFSDVAGFREVPAGFEVWLGASWI